MVTFDSTNGMPDTRTVFRQLSFTEKKRFEMAEPIDSHAFHFNGGATSSPGHSGSVQPVGCISKKTLFFLLRPDCRNYRPGPIRDFLNSERLARCGLTAEQLHHIRIFPPEASAVIVQDLRQLKFL